MKIALCVASGGVDMYGYLRRYSEQFTTAARVRGVDVEVLRYPDANFYPRLLANLADEECIVHFYGYLFDFKVPDAWACGQNVSIIDYSRAVTVASIGDHPFASFMQNTVRNAHPRTRFIVMEESFQDEMGALNPTVADARYDYQPISPPVNYDGRRATDFECRTYDLVVPMYMTDLTGQDMAFVRSHLEVDWFEKAIVDAYECLRCDIRKSPFHVLHEFVQFHIGLTFAQIRDHNPPLFKQLLLTMTALDAIVRQERRQKMVQRLLRSTGDLRVAVTCDPIPAMKVADNVEFVGSCLSGDVARLMADARAVLNCNPSYPSSLHERVVSGMLYGSCVITDVNTYIDTGFSADEYLAYAPDSEMSIADIYAAHDMAAIAAAGAKKVRRDPSYSWDGHINRLMHTALC